MPSAHPGQVSFVQQEEHRVWNNPNPATVPKIPRDPIHVVPAPDQFLLKVPVFP